MEPYGGGVYADWLTKVIPPERPTPVRLSQLLSHALRHHPDRFGITLSQDGFGSLSGLAAGLAQQTGHPILVEEILAVVEEYGEGRFLIQENAIRAQYGHTVPDIHINFISAAPPELLYHGTLNEYVGSIKEHGLLKHNHSHVHLSDNLEESLNVGGRRGESVGLVIHTADMASDGFQFFKVNTSIWLTVTVPPKYLTVLDS